MSYVKTNWVNGTTPLNADNMNKIENELEAQSSKARNILSALCGTKKIHINTNSDDALENVILIDINGNEISPVLDATYENIAIIASTTNGDFSMSAENYIDGYYIDHNGETAGFADHKKLRLRNGFLMIDKSYNNSNDDITFTAD